MATYRLLTPPDEEQDIYPYRRVWRSLTLESALLFAITGVIFVLFNYIGVTLPEALNRPVSVALALAPAGLWLVFSLWREQFALEPRRRLIAVVIASALVANAIGIPFVENVLQPERWLPLSGTVNRIIGYAFTIGVVQETLKYLVVRYLAWDDCFRIRLDSVAYTSASAVGYATVAALSYVLSESLAPDVAALRVAEFYAAHMAASLIVSYGLSEVRFDNPNPFLLASTVALGALLTGFVIAFRAGLVNAGFSLEGSAPSFLFGFGLSIAAFTGVAVVFAFLYENAERRARESAAAREV